MNSTAQLPQITPPTTRWSTLRRVLVTGTFIVFALIMLAGIIGVALTATSSNEPAGSASSAQTLEDEGSQSQFTASSAAEGESIAPTTTLVGESGDDSTVAPQDPSVEVVRDPEASEVPEVPAVPADSDSPELPLWPAITPGSFPIVPIDLVGPTMGRIPTWCDPNFRWEVQVTDRSGVESVYATYQYNGRLRFVRFEKGALDNGWWGGTGVADPQGLGFQDLVITARDSLGNVSRTPAWSGCS